MRVAAAQAAQLQFRFGVGLQCDRFGPGLRRVADADVVITALRLDNQVRRCGTIAFDRVGDRYEEEVSVDFLLSEVVVLVVDALRQHGLAKHDSRRAALKGQLSFVEIGVLVDRPVDLESLARVADNVTEGLLDGQQLVLRRGRAGEEERENHEGVDNPDHNEGSGHSTAGEGDCYRIGRGCHRLSSGFSQKRALQALEI